MAPQAPSSDIPLHGLERTGKSSNDTTYYDAAYEMPPTVSRLSTPAEASWLHWLSRPKKAKRESFGRLTPVTHELHSDPVEKELSTLEATLAACVIVEPEVRDCKLKLVPRIADAEGETIEAINPDAPQAPLERISVYVDAPQNATECSHLVSVYVDASQNGGDDSLSLPAVSKVIMESADVIQPAQPMINSSLPLPKERQVSVEATLQAQKRILDILANENVVKRPSTVSPHVGDRPFSSACPASPAAPQHQQQLANRELLVSEVIDITRHAVGELRNAYNRNLQLLYMMEGGQRPKRFMEYLHLKRKSSSLRRAPSTTPRAVNSLPSRQPTSQFLNSPSQNTAAESFSSPSPMGKNQNTGLPHVLGVAGTTDEFTSAEKAVFTEYARDNVRLLKSAIHALSQLSQGGKKYDNQQE